jgi:hypothetical protein
MKKMTALLLIVMLMLFSVGCDILNQSPSKLVELERYSTMTIDGTTSIEVVYAYDRGEVTTYEFVIEDQETINQIMIEVFNTELEDYPGNLDIAFYQRWIIVHQGDIEYHIDLCYNSDENGNRYLYQSNGTFDIIEKYIEDNLMK